MRYKSGELNWMNLLFALVCIGLIVWGIFWFFDLRVPNYYKISAGTENILSQKTTNYSITVEDLERRFDPNGLRGFNEEDWSTQIGMKQMFEGKCSIYCNSESAPSLRDSPQYIFDKYKYENRILTCYCKRTR
jgi:hypothetical protein